MTDAPNEQEGGTTPGGDSPLGQSDIDDLFGGGAESPASDVHASDSLATPDDDGAGALGQSDIDDLFGGGDSVQAGSGAAEPAAAVADMGGLQEINQADIDALMQASGGSPAPKPEPDTRVDTLGRPFDDMAAAMQAAIEEEQAVAPAPPPLTPAAPPVPPPSTEMFDLRELSSVIGMSVDPKRMTMLNDVNLNVKIELGRTRMLVEEVLKLGEGSVVELDKLAGDPVDVYVNGRLVARGEVLVLNDNFCVRISEVLTNDPHRVSA